MPAGDNGGSQLNLVMAELGMISKDPLGFFPDIVTTVAVHPLVVVPSSIRYTDTSRSSVEQTHGGAVVNKAGRALRSVQFVGTFGVESRGLGLYIGTGDLRFKKFWHEIVRLADAVNSDQVNAEKDLFRSPLLGLPLALYDPTRSSFFVNYYDFWHDVQFEASPSSFSFSKLARQGSATGLTPYQLQLQEVGPIVTGGLGTTLIQGLFAALTAWDEINEQIKSYTLDAIATSLADAGGILVGQFTDSVNAVKAQINGATALMNGFSDPAAAIEANVSDTFAADSTASDGGFGSPSDKQNAAKYARREETAAAFGPQSKTGLGAFLRSADRLADYGKDLIDVVHAAAPPEVFETENGAVRWGAVVGEGSLVGLDTIDQQEGLQEVIAAARFQPAAGSLYGMSRAEFAAFLHPNGESGRDPNLAGTLRHVVTDYDTAHSIRHRYGVRWEAVLKLNRVTPDEALLVGTVLQIPRERHLGQQAQISALPVFGSHAGQSAWGADLYADCRVDTAGRLQILSGPDLLIQGVDWTIEQFGEEIETLANQSPPVVRDAVIRSRVAALLASDRRIASVDRVDTATDDAGGLVVTSSITAINGDTISTAQGAR